MEVRVLWKSTCVLPHIKTPSQLWFFVFTADFFWIIKPVRRTRISVYPHTRIFAYPHTRISVYPHIRIPAYPHTRISAYPHIRVPAFSTKPVVKVNKYTEIWNHRNHVYWMCWEFSCKRVLVVDLFCAARFFMRVL